YLRNTTLPPRGTIDPALGSRQQSSLAGPRSTIAEPRSTARRTLLSPGAQARLRRRQHPPQHVRQQPAVPVVLDIVRRIDARDGLEGPHLPVLATPPHGDALPGGESGRDPLHVVGLPPGEPERRRCLAGQKLERQDAHADEIAPVDALVALRE